jgi:Cu(I)/Ag(I) efflux system membrane fusion protein/cobalt-zinc-cadmium efflux system membrane fusion protein
MKHLLKYFTLAAVFFAFVASAPLPLPQVADEHLHWLSAAHAAEKYTCGMHPMVIVDEPGDCPICGMALTPLKESGAAAEVPAGERKIKYWVAPMDPTFIRDEPGKSPMGMDLVPVYEDQATGGSIISIDPVTAQNMNVRSETVQRRTLQRSIKTIGIVDYMEPRKFSINTKISGWIERLYVDETGQNVKKGQKLLDIYSPELVTAQEEYLLALANFQSVQNSPFPEVVGGARRLLEASRSRLEFWDISSRQIKQLEKAGKASRTLTIHASHKGIVTRKNVENGMFVKSGMELFKIADISRVWVNADIYEYELPWVKVGQQADIVLPFVGNKSLKGKISYIYPYVEAKTRTVTARIELDNRRLELKPEMYVNIRIQSDVIANALSVPIEAVLYSGEKQTVFVALEGGKFEPRQIKTGVQNEEGYIEVVQGLFEGERVVTSAQFMLDSESKLRAAIAKMLEPKKDDSATRHQSQDESMDDLFEDDKNEKKNAKEENLDDLFN